MAKRKRHMRVTAKVVMNALAQAEAEHERPPAHSRKPRVVRVDPKEVEFWLELFQPRKFREGLHEVNAEHVKELAGRILRKGELDPITVIKIGGRWYCVDGHHRLAAYRAQKWKGPIKAEWFAGSLREAMDYSVERNEVAKLPIDNADKRDEAWRRVVMGWGSKAAIVQKTGASDGTVAKMRRILAAYEKQTEEGQRLKQQLGGDIRDCMWAPVQQAWDGYKPGDFNLEEAAGVLSRTIGKRLTNRLKQNIDVTALALWYYDAGMCAPLASALHRIVREKTNEQRALESIERLSRAHEPDDE
jgi:hypothetical protein